MRETKAERLEKQRKRQADYRAKQKKERRPNRDDFARIAFHWLIVSMDKQTRKTGDPSGQVWIEDMLITRLVEQGFDEKACEDVLAMLTDKYVKEGWAFQRKPHLLQIMPEENDS